MTTENMKRETERVYTINFDFRNREQRRILEYMQQRGYKLLGFKGAEGDCRTAGLPVWFSVPYIKMRGEVRNEYKPLYKVYYMNSPVQPDVPIRMDALSEEIRLGARVTLHVDGTFSVEYGGPENEILFVNDRPVDTGRITAGLAALVNGEYSPFCAFDVGPHRSLRMKPNEKVSLFAVPTIMRTGSLADEAVSSGCLFDLMNPDCHCIDLEMDKNGNRFNPVACGVPMRRINSGQPLMPLMAA